jgi:hypothetical protein
LELVRYQKYPIKDPPTNMEEWKLWITNMFKKKERKEIEIKFESDEEI